MISILFVCTGNICRSPTADAIFKHLVKEQGIEDKFFIDSVGLQGYHNGESPDIRSVEIAKENGISMDNIYSRRITHEDYIKFDVILAMDKGHYDTMVRQCPDKSKISMFLESGEDVPDPWYGNGSGFERVFDMIHYRCEILLEEILKDDK